MKINLKHKFLLLLVAGMSLQSCEKYLEEDLTGVMTTEHYKTKEGYEQLVRAAYQPLRTFFGTQDGFTASVFGTDTYTNAADGGFKFVNQYTSQLDSRTSVFRNTWNDFYRAINTTNAIIDRADQVEPATVLTDAAKTGYVAEARYLRGLYYFYLVQMFGDIHLTLKENTEVQLEAKRTPQADIYKAIIEDLEFAVAQLPAEQKDYGRATKPAAEHLLAKVYLTRGYKSYAQPGDFAKAAQLATDVIQKYKFELLPKYEDIFDINNQTNKEVIWSVQYTNDPLTNGSGNSLHLYFLMEYDIRPGMKRDVLNGRPFKRARPTPYTLSLFDMEKDARYHGSFKTVYYSNNASTIPKDASGKPLFAEGDTAIYLPGKELSAARKAQIAKKGYLLIEPSQYDERLFLSLKKFIDPLRPDLTAEAGSRDFIFARLGETYLIAAEAYFKAGNVSEALKYINAIRERAEVPGQTLVPYTAATLNIDTILDERARELLGECHRWFDLVRTGKLVERVKLYNAQARNNIKDYHVLRPIPADQIDRTAGGNDAFPQNPGY